MSRVLQDLVVCGVISALVLHIPRDVNNGQVHLLLGQSVGIDTNVMDP